jgi:hypothetical protein
MSDSAGRGGRWRMRWAERENDRRGGAYAGAIDEWRRRDTDLRAKRQAAATFAARAGAGTLPVALRRGERIYRTVTGVQSVEAPHTTVLPPITWAEPGDPAAGPIPPGIRVRDHGTAVITSHRLLFIGTANNREWAYDRLTGLIHDPTAPMTLLHVTNRKTASGLVIPGAAAAVFRFDLQLALADAAGQRAGLVALLDHSIRDHERLRPMPPVPAEPGRAPVRAAWSPLRVVAAGVAAFALLICVIGVLAPSPKTKPHTPSDAAAHPALVVTTTRTSSHAAPPSASTAVLSPTTVPAPATTITKPSVPHPATSRPTTRKPAATPKPVATPKPKPKPVDLCGAPANPLRYTFCSGGSLITSPDESVCLYFDCIASFDDGVGYMIQCQDGTVSMSGGRSGSCSHHGGNRRPVHRD